MRSNFSAKNEQHPCHNGPSGQVRDVIMTIATPATLAAKNATKTIPVVFLFVADPVGGGFVASRARPGGNLTGLSSINLELSAKPHRRETFKLSSDPLFIDKVRDIVGLYLNPPDRALVLCVDEKAQI